MTNSRIVCFNKCLMGPAGSKSPIVTNMINFLMIGLNIATLNMMLDDGWIWLISINIAIGCLT